METNFIVYIFHGESFVTEVDGACKQPLLEGAWDEEKSSEFPVESNFRPSDSALRCSTADSPLSDGDFTRRKSMHDMRPACSWAHIAELTE